MVVEKLSELFVFILLSTTFFRSSTFIDRFKQMWQDVYSVSDVLDNDFMALLSRIAYVQEREPKPSSMIVGVGF